MDLENKTEVCPKCGQFLSSAEPTLCDDCRGECRVCGQAADDGGLCADCWSVFRVDCRGR